MPPVLLFTIDIESNWGGRSLPSEQNLSAARSVMPRLLDIFNAGKIPATWFIAGETIQFLQNELRLLGRSHHEIASHGYAHRNYARFSRDDMRADLIRSRQSLLIATGHHAVSFRAPRFCIHPFHNEVIRENGFTYDCSRICFRPSFKPSEATPGSPIKDLDLVRLTPLGIKPGLLFIDKIGTHLFSAILQSYPHDYLVLYMHPFDFINPLPPSPAGMPPTAGIWHRLNLHNRFTLLENIIGAGKKAGCTFATVAKYCRNPFAMGS